MIITSRMQFQHILFCEFHIQHIFGHLLTMWVYLGLTFAQQVSVWLLLWLPLSPLFPVMMNLDVWYTISTAASNIQKLIKFGSYLVSTWHVTGHDNVLNSTIQIRSLWILLDRSATSISDILYSYILINHDVSLIQTGLIFCFSHCLQCYGRHKVVILLQLSPCVSLWCTVQFCLLRQYLWDPHWFRRAWLMVLHLQVVRLAQKGLCTSPLWGLAIPGCIQWEVSLSCLFEALVVGYSRHVHYFRDLLRLRHCSRAQVRYPIQKQCACM